MRGIDALRGEVALGLEWVDHAVGRDGLTNRGITAAVL